MGYARALLQRDVRREERALQKKAKKKGLWGSIGRTLGGLGATLLTAGAAAPWAIGLAAGAGTFAGGALGSQWAGKIGKGKFFQEERESLEKQLDPFGEANVVGALKSAVTAGMGQKLELMKSARAAKALDPKMTDEAVKAMSRGKGFDFGESALGRGWDKYVTQPKAIKAAGEQARLGEYLQQSGDFATEFGEGGGLGSKRFAQSMNQPINISEFNVQQPIDTSYEFGGGGGDPRGLQRMRVSRPDPSALTQQMPRDTSFEFGAGGGKSDPFKRDIGWDEALYDYRDLFEKLGIKSGMSTVIRGK